MISCTVLLTPVVSEYEVIVCRPSQVWQVCMFGNHYLFQCVLIILAPVPAQRVCSGSWQRFRHLHTVANKSFSSTSQLEWWQHAISASSRCTWFLGKSPLSLIHLLNASLSLGQWPSPSISDNFLSLSSSVQQFALHVYPSDYNLLPTQWCLQQSPSQAWSLSPTSWALSFVTWFEEVGSTHIPLVHILAPTPATLLANWRQCFVFTSICTIM